MTDNSDDTRHADECPPADNYNKFLNVLHTILIGVLFSVAGWTINTVLDNRVAIAELRKQTETLINIQDRVQTIESQANKPPEWFTRELDDLRGDIRELRKIILDNRK